MGVQPHREPPQAGDKPCTQTIAPPVVDTVFAITSGLFALVALGLAVPAHAHGDDSTGYVALGASLAAVAGAYTGSAIYGYHHVSKCRASLAP
jgi:hypothetical protein